MKRFAVLLLTALLALAAASALALEATGYDSEETRDWATNKFFARMEEKTGVSVTGKAINDKEEYAKLLDDMQAGNVTADILFKAELSRSQETALIDAGAIVDLAPYIEENMPNLSALLNAHPEWREAITLEDGRIASLPLINEQERQVCVYINKAWLDQLGLDMPNSLQALTEALEAFKTGDPNGNMAQDEVPASLTGVWEMRWLLPYFGIVADDYHIARVDGEAVFAPELPAYRDFVAMLTDWYARGLILPRAFTDVHGASLYQETDEDAPVTAGMLVSLTPYTHVRIDAVTQYEPLLIPGADGEIVWRDMLGSVWTGTFAVTSRCEDVAAALRWVDALYSEEGVLVGYAGIEGEDYLYQEDGSWIFDVDSFYTVDNVRADVLMYTGSTMPGVAPNAFLSKVDSEVDRHVIAASAKVHAYAQQVTPPYALSDADQAKANALAGEIGRMVDVGIAQFVTGEVPLDDEHWAAWLDALREAGSGELTALF